VTEPDGALLPFGEGPVMVLQLGADEANGKSLLGNSPFKVWFEFIFAPVA